MSRKQFRLYNTLTKRKEVFTPIVDGKVGMYVCGVTVYDFSHIGHARAYVAFDVLYRYLRYLGYDVVYVRNFTDIDDKIIHQANKSGEDPIKLSARFCQEFLTDMADLQCLPPTRQPKVTDHIDQIKHMIAQIIANGHAYPVDGGDVYFSVDNLPNYGVLSGRKPGDNRPGERVTLDDRKRNHADFVLWKAAKPGEPQWDSPWGPGRPGWHIECSAMSSYYLTHAFDIHGGGIDLTFPHHENELAQNCAACPESKITYWMHNGFVTANDVKMSKSLKNFEPIRDITKKYHPLALRYFLLGTHYRSPINYTISQLDIASESIFYTYQTLHECEDALSSSLDQVVVVKTGKSSKLRDELETKLADDLHTPTILNSTLQGALKSVNSFIKRLNMKPEKRLQLSIKESLVDLHTEIRNILDVLGLLSNLSYIEVLQQLKDKALTRAGLTEDHIRDYIKERTLARQDKDFSKSDDIRSELAAMGISLMDVGEEMVWQPSRPAT